MSELQAYLTLCRREQWQQGRLWRTECRGDALSLEKGAFRGAVFLAPVDSGEPGFRWSRVKLRASIPRDAGVRVYARATDVPDWPEWDEPIPEGRGGERLVELFGAARGAGTDVWLPDTGRWLYLALELTAGDVAEPVVESVSLRMRGDHMTDYLPAIYRGQDFTYRYLSIFDSILMDMEHEIDTVSRRFSLRSADGEMLSFLARWLCSSAAEDTASLRERLKGALESYETMYTARMIKKNAEALAGREPKLIEYYQVAYDDPRCPNPELYRKLYGDNPYRFFLLFPEDTFATQRDMERFLDAMKELIPAGTELELVLLKSSVQLDWYTYLGVNTCIGNYTPAELNENMAIHFNTTIGGEDHER